MRHTYDITEEPRDEVYRALVDFCAARAATVLLVLREMDWLDDSARAFISQFQKSALQEQNATEWPGTKLTSRTATLFRYRITPDLIDYLKTNADGLYEWQQPERLEDLSFLREDGSTLLATIAHEHDAYVVMTPAEYKGLSQSLPALHVVKHTRANDVV
jgi:hypothetical protein